MFQDWLPNNKSAILVRDYETPKDLVDYLNELNNDDDLYNSYLKHKITGEIDNQFLLNEIKKRNWVIDKENAEDVHFFEAFECFLCDEIDNEYGVNSGLVYNCPDLISPLTKQVNVTNWWNDFWREGRCQAHLLRKYIADRSIKKITQDMFEIETRRLINDGLC